MCRKLSTATYLIRYCNDYKASKVTLAKSVLTSLPLYVMQSSKLPRGVCDDIDKIVKQFIWVSSVDQRRIHLLSWGTMVCIK
ncbi:hypothetical protein V2J09_018174 [Rumex salicifolius]